jgi:hypothetical protein
MPPYPALRRTATALAALLVVIGASCTNWLFSGVHMPDRSRPAVLIETQGGVEHGVATVHGVLFLGRTAQSGPCRVWYTLGDTVTIEDGEIRPFAGMFYEARIDLQTPDVHLLPRALTPDDDVFAMVYTRRGAMPKRVHVRRAREEGLAGDLLEDPRSMRPDSLPIGAPLFVDGPRGSLLVAGLVSGHATWQAAPTREPQRLVVFAGPERLREALAVPRVDEQPVPTYRPDGITVLRERDRPVRPDAAPDADAETAPGGPNDPPAPAPDDQRR